MSASHASAAVTPPPIHRRLRFIGGFLLGFVVLPVAGLVVAFIVMLMLPDRVRRPSPRLEVAVAGRDVSQAGGSAVKIEGRDEGVRQACREACDDLTFAGATAISINILGPSGACVVCKTLRNRRLGLSQPWAVGGRPHLSIERRKGAAHE